MAFLGGFADWVGKAIPNEISKTNAISKYTQYIPVVGPFLSAAQKGVSAVDNFATAYGDERDSGGGNLGTAIQGAQLGIQGQSASPGDYNNNFNNASGRNFFDVGGQALNFAPSSQKSSFEGGGFDIGSVLSAFGGSGGGGNDIAQNQQQAMALALMLQNRQRQEQQRIPNIQMPQTQSFEGVPNFFDNARGGQFR